MQCRKIATIVDHVESALCSVFVVGTPNLGAVRVSTDDRMKQMIDIKGFAKIKGNYLPNLVEKSTYGVH